jgi:hypothetical protein
MAKKAGSRKKVAPKRKTAAVNARRVRKPTRTECTASGIFKGHSAIFSLGGCDEKVWRRWAAYLKKHPRKKR